MVPSSGRLLDPSVVDIRSYISDLDPIITESLSPLGIMDYRDLVSRVLFGRAARHPVIRTTSFGSIPRNYDGAAFLPNAETGTVVRRRFTPTILAFGVDRIGNEITPQQPRAVSTGGLVPTRRIFEGFSVSTSGHTLRPRRSLFGFFERNAE